MNQYTAGKGSHMDRFWASVKKGDGCWEWMGVRNAAGYGLFFADGARQLAHRAMLATVWSPPLPGFVVRHSCDNPPCVRPEHLLVGLPRDNSRDMVRRGRQSAGENRPQAKLTEEIVSAIRASVADGATQSSLAAEFGVNQSTISRTAHALRWRGVQG